MVLSGNCWNYKLTDQDVKKIRSMIKQGINTRAIAKEFDIGIEYVRKIRLHRVRSSTLALAPAQAGEGK